MKAVVVIHTWKKAENPTKWRIFEIDETKKYKFEADNLFEAELKVLKAFPANMCIGFNIQMENGDFACTMIKDAWHYEGNPETIEIFGTDHPTDEQIREHQIKIAEIAIKNRNKN